MNWKPHTNMVNSKLYYRLSILCKLDKIVHIHILNLIYFYVFHCHLIVLVSGEIIMIQHQNI